MYRYLIAHDDGFKAKSVLLEHETRFTKEDFTLMMAERRERLKHFRRLLDNAEEKSGIENLVKIIEHTHDVVEWLIAEKGFVRSEDEVTCFREFN
jgi:hypothetical protein